ncbi:hypothetical protein Tco_1539919 [Tanacetum coccineum]
MALNDRGEPPLEAWENPYYWLAVWRETYSHKVGRPKKKRKRSKHEDEPFVKDGKLSKKGIEEPLYVNPMETLDTIRQHAKGKVESGNNAEASGSASGQAQQAEPIISQDGLVGSGVGDVIGLSAAGGQEGSGGAGVGVGSQVPVTKTRNVDGREMGDGIPTQSSAAGGASEWSILEVMKDEVSQEHMCEEEVPFNKNKGKLSCDLVEMPSKAVKQEMCDHAPDEIDGAKGKHVPNYVGKKDNLEFLVCKPWW